MKRLLIMIALLPAGLAVWAQTSIDLRTQGKNIDFSGAAFTRPVKTGTVLPAACQTGELYFRTSDTPGQNLWACVGTNTWLRISSAVSSVFGRSGSIAKSKGDYNLADLGDVSGKQGSAALAVMFGGGSVAAGDCAQFDAGGNIVSAGAACGGGGGGGGGTLQSGTGVAITTIGSISTIAVDTSVVPTFLVAAPIIDFPSIPGQSCAEQTVTFTGVAVGNGIVPGWPDSLENGLVGVVRATAANTVAVRLCNVTGVAVNPASQTFLLTAVRGF